MYRLLGLRSLSVGDVVAVSTGDHTQWLACEPFGWRQITAPSHAGGETLSAQRIYADLHARRALTGQAPTVTWCPGATPAGSPGTTPADRITPALTARR